MKAKSKQYCQENTDRLLHLVDSLGWIINYHKSDLVPTHEIKFSGYKLNIRVGLVFSMQKKINLLTQLQGS